MSSTAKVIKNSIWLIIQPLILNVISLFVIGYIASTLGQASYGKFIFAFSFISMFSPFTNFGLGSITTRDISENKNEANKYLGNMIFLKTIIGSLIFLLVVIIINFMRYPIDTKIVVYLAGLTLIFNAVATTFYSAFQGFEKMEYVSSSQFFSGLILTILSVLVLFWGFRLIGLTIVYVTGNFLGLVLAASYCYSRCTKPSFKINTAYWKSSLLRGFPFFLPAIIGSIGAKIGFIFLSKMGGDASVGIYGAANNLIEKLTVIPDGICTAIFPTMASIYLVSKIDAGKLFQRVFQYMILLGLPIAVGITVLAKQIISLVYGSTYMDSSLVLQILVWNYFVSFLVGLAGWSLGAVHQEKRTAIVMAVITILSIVFSFIFISKYKDLGFAISNLLVGVITLIVLLRLTRRFIIKEIILLKPVIYIVIMNLIMGATIYLTAKINFMLAVVLGIILYCTLAFAFRLLTKEDVKKFRDLFKNRMQL